MDDEEKDEEDEKKEDEKPKVARPPTAEEIEAQEAVRRAVVAREWEEQIGVAIAGVIGGLRDQIEDIKAMLKEHGTIADATVRGEYKGLRVKVEIRTLSSELQTALQALAEILEPAED